MLKYRGANLALHRKQIMKLVRVLKNTSKFLAGAGKQPSTQSSRNASDAYARNSKATYPNLSRLCMGIERGRCNPHRNLAITLQSLHSSSSSGALSGNNNNKQQSQKTVAGTFWSFN
jgi:hypothetical protein